MALVIMRGSGVFAKILLARSITPFEYGLITLFVISIPGFLQDVTNFCFFDIMGHASEGKRYFGFSFLYGIISTAILAILFVIFHESIFSFLNIPSEYWSLLTIVLFVVLFSVTIGGTITGFLRGIRNHTVAAMFSAAPGILRIVFIALAVFIFQINDFTMICVLFALPPLAALIPVIVLKFHSIWASLQEISIPSKEIFFFGFSFFILNVWAGISQQINSVIISHDLGVVWQGYFDISLSLVAVITFFSGAIYLISAPESTADTGSTEFLTKRGGIGETGRLLFSLCILSIIVLYFYSAPLVTLLFTSRYLVAADYLYILAIGYAVLFVQQYIAFLTLRNEKGISKLSLITIVGILIFPLFSHMFILTFGFIGAYLSTTIFIGIYTLATIYVVKDRAPLRLLFSGISRLAAAGVALFLIISIINLSLIPGLILSVVVFMVLVISFGYLDRHIVTDLLGIIRLRR